MEKTLSTLEEITDFFLSKSPMTHSKLQVLLYYSYSWVMVLLNEEEIEKILFEEKIIPGTMGPYIKEILNQYKKYGYDYIPTKKEVENNIQKEVLNILEEVWEVYGGYNERELLSIATQEEPWKKGREGLQEYEAANKEMDIKEIYKYYKERKI